MREEIEDVFAPEDMDFYRRYWEAKADPSVRMPEMEEEDYGAIASICIMKQEYDKAEQVLEEALGRYPHDDELLFDKVEMLASTERMDEAYKVLDEIEAWYPNNEESLAMRAGLYMSQERYEESEELFRRYEAMGGDEGVAAAGLAQCLAVRGQRTEGFRKICQYLKSEPFSAEACNRFIVWVIEWEMLDEAAEVLHKMTAEQPYNKFLWKLLYEICEMQEDYDGAKEANEYALAIDPDDYEAHGRRILYCNLCDETLVEESFNRFKPDMWTEEQRFYFYGIMADYAMDHDQPEREKFYIRQMLSAPVGEPIDRATLYYRLASRVFRQEDTASVKEALDNFCKAEQALRAVEKPEAMLVSDIYRGIGQCRLLLGEEDAGVEALRKAWRLCPNNEMAVFDYFLNLCVLGRLEAAMADITVGLSEDGPATHGVYKLLKGAVLYYMRKPKQAVSCLMEAFLADEGLRAVAEEAVPDMMADPEVRKQLGDATV